MENPQVKAATEKISAANALVKKITTAKELLVNMGKGVGVKIDVYGLSSSYHPEVSFTTNGEDKNAAAASYANLYEFVAKQDNAYGRLAAVFVADCMREIERDIAHFEAELVELFS